MLDIRGQKASLAIEDGSVLAGDLAARQLKMVQVWMDIHRDELFADGELDIATRGYLSRGIK